MAQLELQDVNKIYRSRGHSVHAVSDFSLAVADGEFVALLGPSGCGKSSTLRMIVGLEDISSGEIRFDGQRVNELGPERRNVAMAFETYALYPSFTVAENLSFPLEVRGLSATERRRKVEEIAAILHIDNILDQTPATLSGGQQQRVGLGRALVRDPAVFILDEVLSHIDAHLKFQMLFELKRIHQDLGGTTVFVTHDQVEALALSDRVAVMNEGKLQQFGTRDELYHTPANVFVADFIGEPPTNFFRVGLDEDGTRVSLRSAESELVFFPGAKRSQAVRRTGHSRFVVGVRPQNFSLVGSEGAETLPAEVLIDEYLGEQTILTLCNGSDRFSVLAPPDVALDQGEKIDVFYMPQDLMIFDQVSKLLIN